MKARINEPCNADWNAMKIVHSGRFCDHCSKTVVDFSGMKREEILQYLLARPNERVCGRIMRSQLDFSDTDYLTVIRNLPQHPGLGNHAFYILALSALTLCGCGNKTKQNVQKTATEQISTEPQQTPAAPDSSISDSATEPIPPLPPEIGEIPWDFSIAGGISIPDPVTPDSMYTHTSTDSAIYNYPQQMPEFPGGIGAMQQWLKENLKYPRREKRKKIEGIVYTSFIVDERGILSDIRIERSVENAPGFDTIVENALHKMPRWSCGRQHGIPVKTRFYLPVEFAL